MAPEGVAAQGATEKGEEEEDEYRSSHLPLAPPSEAFDLSTTVDPSYIISLMRQLLPTNASAAEKEYGDKESEELSMNKGVNEESDCAAYSMQNGEEGSHGANGVQAGVQDMAGRWEEYGCILWDLSANKTHAEFMANNLLLELLTATLPVSECSRITEICLGIIGNLSCHRNLCDLIISTNGLVETVVNQLFLDDSVCLSETFRILAVSFHGSAITTWTDALIPEIVLQRILWIIGNTLNLTLLEKSVEFLVSVVDNGEVASVLLQPLVKLGLPSLLNNLLTCEMGKVSDENKIERVGVLDLILHVIESLSTNDGFVQSIPLNLFHVVCEVIKLPNKVEIASSCACAVTIVANALADDERLASGLSEDLPFLGGLFDVLPFVSDDPQARDALWVVVSKLLERVPDDDPSLPSSHNLASLFLEKSPIIQEDIAVSGHLMEGLEGDSSGPAGCARQAITASLSKISGIVENWSRRKNDDSTDTQKLLDVCRRHVS